MGLFFVCMCVWEDVMRHFFIFSNQTCFLSAVKICGIFVAEGDLLKQCGFLLRSFKIALSFPLRCKRGQKTGCQNMSDSRHLSRNLPADALPNLTVSIRSHPKGRNNAYSKAV